jgi:hypothetical protein
MKEILEKPFGFEPDAWTHKIDMGVEIGKEGNTTGKVGDSTGLQKRYADSRSQEKIQAQHGDDIPNP